MAAILVFLCLVDIAILIMSHYTLPQRKQILEFYILNGKSIRRTHRALLPIYGRHSRPSEQSIRAIIKKFDETFSLHDNLPPIRQRNVRTDETIAAVDESVRENRELSIRRRAQQLGLCASTTWKILRKDLGLRAYKVQLVQQLEWDDHPRRRTFADWALDKLKDDPHFYQKIIFSDEAHFWLNGYVNKQNCRFWSSEQPEEILETPLHPQKITVWCGLHANGIIGPYFFKDEDGANVTVNGERYRDMVEGWFLPNVATQDLEHYWFQQDGATCHTSRQTIDLLKETFGDRVISKNARVDWPPRSCDLTPLDYFLWGHVKALVYADKPQTIEHLEANILREINGIRPEVLERVVQNWVDRMGHVKRSRGGHMHEIIFKH